MIRVLIVDEQAEVRRGLRMCLAVEPDISVIGEAGTAQEALALAQATHPDVIVADIGMEGARGESLVKRLRAATPGAALVVLTLHGDKLARTQAQEAGAQAFLEKDRGATELLQVIRESVALAPSAWLAEPQPIVR